MSTKTSSVTECVTKMRESVVDLKAADTEVINADTLEIDDTIRQGDLYLTLIPKLPEGKASKDAQLAPGQTQGSRHILSGKFELVTDVTFKNVPQALVGPAFKCKGDVELTHPEHGNKILPKGTVWQVTYQRAFAEEIRRVQD